MAKVSKKRYKTKPTIKQRKAAKIAIENGGNVSKAMREAGFSKATAHNPNKLTDSKNWQELMDEYMPIGKLAKVHREGLNSFKKERMIVDTDEYGKPIYELVNTDDFQTRVKYLDLAYKLRGSYAAEKKEVEFSDVTDDELKKDLANELIDLLSGDK